MATLTFPTKIGGVPANVTSVVLCDPAAVPTYGVKRNDTDAVLVAANTAMTNPAVGTYTYSFNHAEGVVHTAWIKWVYAGATNYRQVLFTGSILIAPSTCDQAIYDVCAADPAVAAIVGDRIYPQYVPDGVTGAAVTYQIIDGQDDYTCSGAVGLPDVRVQITAWSAQWNAEGTRAQCNDLFAALVALWKYYVSSGLGIEIQGTYIDNRMDVDGHDERNEGDSRWGRALDVIIAYEE